MSNWDVRDIGTFMVMLLVLPIFLPIYLLARLFVEIGMRVIGFLGGIFWKEPEPEYTAWVDPRPDDLLNGDYE